MRKNLCLQEDSADAVSGVEVDTDVSKMYLMKLNSFTKRLSVAGRWIAATLLFVCATAFAWQGAFLADTAAMAAPHGTLIASDLGDDAKDSTEDARRSNKSFVRNVRDKIEDAAKSNAEKVEDTLGDDNAISRKAKKDSQRIVKRAEEDASRTQKAIDKNLGSAKDALD